MYRCGASGEASNNYCRARATVHLSEKPIFRIRLGRKTNKLTTEKKERKKKKRRKKERKKKERRKKERKKFDVSLWCIAHLDLSLWSHFATKHEPNLIRILGWSPSYNSRRPLVGNNPPCRIIQIN